MIERQVDSCQPKPINLSPATLLQEVFLMKSYLDRFVDTLGGEKDPHDCWQEDGFWPNRIKVKEDDLCVWCCAISFDYIEKGGLVDCLNFISGRTLPEMQLGFRILGCDKVDSVCEQLLEFLEVDYPRDDTTRQVVVNENINNIQHLDLEFFRAIDIDNFHSRIELFAKKFFIQS